MRSGLGVYVYVVGGLAGKRGLLRYGRYAFFTSQAKEAA